MKNIILISIILILSLTNPVSAKGTIQDGLYKIYTGRDRTLNTLAYLKDLKRNGVFFKYSENNNVDKLLWYNNDKLDGIIISYTDKGQLSQMTTYTLGKAINVKVFDAQGKLISEEKY